MSAKTAEKFKLQVNRTATLEWVPISKTKVNLVAQREFREHWANQIFANFDPDKMQTPHVNFRDGHFYIMDGQHTMAALKRWLGSWEDQYVQCWVYRNLSETEEAEMYLSLNTRKGADAFQKFRIAVRAGRETETSIKEIVESKGIVVSKDKHKDNGVQCVGTLGKVFKRDGKTALGDSLEIASSAFGGSGLEAPVIDGLGLLCHRYNGTMNKSVAIESLSTMLGGVKGLLNSAENLRNKTGNAKPDCVAAVAVTTINKHRSTKQKLPNWWKE